MNLTIATVLSDNQLNLHELDMNSMQVNSKRIDSVGLADENINVLVYDQTDDLPNLMAMFEKEQKFYPIAALQSLELTKDSVQNLDAAQLLELYQKVSARWILNNNIKTIEQIYPTISYLKDMWVKDRNSFFEELWFILKTNLATTELNIIFHDLKEPTEKQAEKGDKPKLCYSYVDGKKIPNLFEGKDKEAVLMKEYENEFQDYLNITEYNKDRGQLVACAKIGLSPILVMAKLPNFNQLQRSLMIALFTGLQDS